MYTLVYNILGVPTQGANSSVTTVAAAILLICFMIFIDLIYRIFRSILARGRFD